MLSYISYEHENLKILYEIMNSLIYFSPQTLLAELTTAEIQHQMGQMQ